MTEQPAQEATITTGTETVPMRQTEGQEPEVEQQGTKLEDLTEIRAELNRARKEAAKYRKSAQMAQEAEEQRQRDEMSEIERLRADMAKIKVEAQEADERARLASIRAAVVAAANGMNDPEDALRLLDIDALEIDESGNIVGLDDAIAALLKAKPYLAKTKGGITPTNPAAGPQGKTYEQMRAEVYGTSDTPFMRGSGVRMPPE